MGAKARLGDILLEAGEIDAAQLEAALREQDETGRPLGMTLVSMGALPETALVRTLARQLSLPMARLEGKRVGSEVLELVPSDLAEKHHCFPLFVKEEENTRSLYLGMEDASDLDAIEEVAAATGMQIRPVLVAPSEIEEALHRQYHVIASDSPAPLRVASEPASPASAAGALPPPPTDPGFDGTGLSADLGDLNDVSIGDAQFDSQGLRDGDSGYDLTTASDGLGNGGVPGGDESPAERSRAGAEPDGGDPALAAELELGPLGDDSLDDFAPELELDVPELEADAAPPASRSEDAADARPIPRDAILRALTQLLVEKGVIERDELIARVHRESRGDGE